MQASATPFIGGAGFLNKLVFRCQLTRRQPTTCTLSVRKMEVPLLSLTQVREEQAVEQTVVRSLRLERTKNQSWQTDDEEKGTVGIEETSWEREIVRDQLTSYFGWHFKIAEGLLSSSEIFSQRLYCFFSKWKSWASKNLYLSLDCGKVKEGLFCL